MLARHCFAVVCLAGVAACEAPQASSDQNPAGASPSIVISDAVCRPTPNGRNTTACYLNLVSTAEDRLVAVTSDAAPQTQMHSSSMDGGMMSMAPMSDGLALPAGKTVGFVTGGDHIMLTGVTKPLVAGDTVRLTLDFQTAADQTLDVPVGQPTPANAAPAA